MGLLIKHQLKKFVQFHKENNHAGFVRLDEAPYTIGKLVKIMDEWDSIDFKARKLQYYIGQVQGYKIFFVHAGFHEVPTEIISDERIKEDIDDMCKWYKETIISQYQSLKKYKL